MTSRLSAISTHHWLKHPTQSVFHAYLVRTLGSTSVCGKGNPIQNLSEMDIPGDRSTCCIDCYSKLYGVDPYTSPVERL